MPELIEVKIMSEYINAVSKDYTYTSVHLSDVTKNKLPEDFLNFQNFTIHSKSRGKELMICLNNDLINKSLYFAMGMSGTFVLSSELIKHTHLWFERNDGKKLCLVDVRRFAKWKEANNWNKNRGPCPYHENEKFTNNLNFYILNKEKLFIDKSIGEILMDQRIFNGIGNYLRAEIIALLNIEPWKNSLEVLKDKKLFDKLTKLCYLIPKTVYALGGGEIKDWKNPFNQENKFEEWLSVYGKQSFYIDKTGRRMWYKSKFKNHEKTIQNYEKINKN